jgi:hypothetical protein
MNNNNINKGRRADSSFKFAGVLVVLSAIITLGAAVGLFSHVYAESGVSGKITFLPWDGKSGSIVYLPPARDDLNTIVSLPPAIVSSGIVSV